MPRSPNLQTFPQFEAQYPAFEGRIRWIYWRSRPVTRTRRGDGDARIVEDLEPNGFADAFIKVAGRLYVDVEAFWRIVEQQNGRGGDAA